MQHGCHLRVSSFTAPRHETSGARVTHARLYGVQGERKFHSAVSVSHTCVQCSSGGVMKPYIPSCSVCVRYSVCLNSFTHVKLILAAAQFRVEHVVNCRTPLNRRLQCVEKSERFFTFAELSTV